MYDKAKVTIDLDEYNSLYEIKNKYETNDELAMAKEVCIVAIMASSYQGHTIVDEMRKSLMDKGIDFWVTTNAGNGKPLYEINLKRRDKQSRV